MSIFMLLNAFWLTKNEKGTSRTPSC